MKRSELKIGQEAELRTYGDSFETVVVVDTEPWVDTTSRNSYRPSRYRPAADWSTKRNGVAVAQLRRFLSSEPPTWVPNVVQLSQLFPVGTAAQKRQEREIAQAEKVATAARAAERKQAITDMLGLGQYDLQYPYRQYGANGYVDHGHVEIPTSKLLELAQELSRYRELYGEQHTTPANEPHTVDN